jgi:hypothetical protein
MAQQPIKLKDLVVKTNEYSLKSGEKKFRTVNIGSLMQGDDNSNYLLINRTFNPAGVILNPKNSDQILVSMYEPRVKGENYTGANAGTSYQNAGFDDMESDVPF